MSTAVGIDHQQMDRVTTHVEDTQSHDNNLVVATTRVTLRPECQEVRVPESSSNVDT